MDSPEWDEGCGPERSTQRLRSRSDSPGLVDQPEQPRISGERSLRQEPAEEIASS